MIDKLNEQNDRGVQEVKDALVLLEFAVESGFKTPEGNALPVEVISGIRCMAGKLGIGHAARPLPADLPPLHPSEIACADWVSFEVAYQRLAGLLAPVTAKTLRDTQDCHSSSVRTRSPALQVTNVLWVAGIAYAVIVVLGDWTLQSFDPPLAGNTEAANLIMVLVNILVPYAYGGLGACASLLRSAHEYIHKRTFDVRRRPEYLNRILLGTISGGAIMLYIQQVAGEDGESVRFGPAALGFLAGYSTDLLFNAIERITAAVLPKVGLGSMQQSGPPVRSSVHTTNADLNDLLARLDRAQSEEDKQLYRSLIEKLRDKL